MTGLFVTFEGIDGAGKSTQVSRLQQRWADQGREVVCTREPGGTALSESIRALLLQQDMDALTEALLMFAARRHHVQQVIEPALQRGAVVLCDRFTDASFAYQGGGRGLPLAVLSQLETWVQEGRQPDLTLWFDLSPQEAARRRGAVRAPDRFEQEDVAFFETVRGGYAQRWQQHPQRIARLDAEQPPEAVAQQIDAVLAARGWA